MPDADRFLRAERRIARLTLWLGLAAAVPVAALVSPRAGAGVAAGAVLAWVNYVWLKAAAHALTDVARGQAEGQRARVPASVYAKFFGRYALIAAIVYVMVTRFAIPVASVLGGLLALGAAVMVEGLYEVFAGPE
jgi:hypothetical protein